MSEYIIYTKDGLVRHTAKNVKMSSAYMNVDTLTVNVKSATPIDFTIGDYMDFGVGTVIPSARYVLRDSPEPKKVASSGSYGEAFQYDLTFKNAMWELKNAKFTDIVKNDNYHHFTSLPDVSTYENVFSIKDRIQANMDVLYPDAWVIKTDAAIAAGSDLYKTMDEPKDFSISNGSCFDALALIYTQWKVSYIHTYENGKNIITIGTPELKKDSETTSEFKYGKGNGLKSLKYTVQNKDEIKTRVTAYGNTTNVPSRYYNNKLVKASDGISYPISGMNMFIPNLLIPSSKWGTTTWYRWDASDNTYVCTEKRNPSVGEYSYSYPNIGAKAGVIQTASSSSITVDSKSYTFAHSLDFPDIRKSFYQNADAVSKYGVRPTTIYYDGSDEREDIHPSLKGVTIGQVRSWIGTGGKYYPKSMYADTDRVDEIKSADTFYDNGDITKKIVDKTIVAEQTTETSTKTYYFPTHIIEYQKVADIFEATVEYNGYISLGSRDLRVKVLDSNGKYDTFKLYCQIINNGTAVGDIQEMTVMQLMSTYICHIIPEGTKIKNVPVSAGTIKIRIYVAESTKTELTLNQTIPDDTGGKYNKLNYILSNATYSTYFKITLRQIGFDIRDYLTTENAAVSFLDGYCGGFEFEIKKDGVEYNATNDEWTLTCKRKNDETVNLVYPNKNFSIRQADHFVFLHIEMPDMYVEAKSQHLYDTMIKEKPWEEEFVIDPEIDSIFMMTYAGILRAGMWMHIKGVDIPFDDAFLISNISVDCGTEALPKYSVTLTGHKGDTTGYVQTVKIKSNSVRQLDKRLSTDEGNARYLARQTSRKSIV